MHTALKTLWGTAAFGFAAAISAPAAALYIDPSTNQVYASGEGEIFVTFDSVSAGNSTDVYFDNANKFLFNNQTALPGQQFSLGALSAGAAIVFRAENLTSRLAYFSGLAADSFDGFAHFLFTSNADGSVTAGLEDLEGGGDRDFNDARFTILETEAIDTPLPAPAWLLLSGIAGLAFASRKQANA